MVVQLKMGKEITAYTGMMAEKLGNLLRIVFMVWQ
jgi:hypothetical protein